MANQEVTVSGLNIGYRDLKTPNRAHTDSIGHFAVFKGYATDYMTPFALLFSQELTLIDLLLGMDQQIKFYEFVFGIVIPIVVKKFELYGKVFGRANLY